MNKNTISQLNACRLECDRLIKYAVLTVAQCFIDRLGGIESVEAIRYLKFAKSHMGQVKGYLGDPSPYGTDTPATPADIPPTDAVYDGPFDTTGDLLKDVNHMRVCIEDLKNKIAVLWLEYGNPGVKQKDTDWLFINSSFQAVVTHLTDARFCYGYVLAEIREAQNDPK